MNIIKTDQISILFIKLFIMLINISKLQELIKNIDEKYPRCVPTLIYVVLSFCFVHSVSAMASRDAGKGKLKVSFGDPISVKVLW